MTTISTNSGIAWPLAVQPPVSRVQTEVGRRHATNGNPDGQRALPRFPTSLFGVGRSSTSFPPAERATFSHLKTRRVAGTDTLIPARTESAAALPFGVIGPNWTRQRRVVRRDLGHPARWRLADEYFCVYDQTTYMTGSRSLARSVKSSPSRCASAE